MRISNFLERSHFFLVRLSPLKLYMTLGKRRWSGVALGGLNVANSGILGSLSFLPHKSHIPLLIEEP